MSTSTLEIPTLYVSTGFRDLAHESGVTGMDPNPAGIDVVLRHGSERYAHRELSTALGALTLISPEENPQAADTRVYRVEPANPDDPASLLRTGKRARGVDEVMTKTPTGLVVPKAKPGETEIAWAMYDAARQQGNETEALLLGLPEIIGGLGRLLGPKSPVGQAFEGLGKGLGALADTVPNLKRKADRAAVEQARPVHITRTNPRTK